VRNPPAGFVVLSAELREIEPRSGEKERYRMLLLVLLGILVLIAFGVGFVVHWLFIVAIVLAVIWLISMFTGGFGRTRA
jgi:Flp pilus assembly protein TadB